MFPIAVDFGNALARHAVQKDMTTEQNKARVEILRAHLRQRGLAVVRTREADYSDLGPHTFLSPLSDFEKDVMLSDIVDLLDDADFDAEKTAVVPRATVEHLQALSREEGHT